MQCTICKNGKSEKGKVTVTLERNNSIIIIKQVPAYICQNCGEYTLDEKVTSRIMEIAERAIQNKAEIEVLNYAA